MEAILLGLTQGLTEFLPVSSSGHLLLMERFLGVGNVGVGFTLVCHLGTLLAVCAAMRREVWELVRHPLSRPMRLLIIGSIPTAIIGGLMSVFCRDLLEGEFLVYGFLLTGILLLCCGFAGKPTRSLFRYRDAAVVGVAQGIAALPGLSRSGATVAAATLLGYERTEAARFSFLLSIPVIAGSSLVELLTNGLGGGIGAGATVAALLSSFVSGLLAVRLLLRLLRSRDFDGFAVYLFLLSIFLLLNDYVLHLF